MNRLIQKMMPEPYRQEYVFLVEGRRMQCCDPPRKKDPPNLLDRQPLQRHVLNTTASQAISVQKGNYKSLKMSMIDFVETAEHQESW